MSVLTLTLPLGKGGSVLEKSYLEQIKLIKLIK